MTSQPNFSPPLPAPKAFLALPQHWFNQPQTLIAIAALIFALFSISLSAILVRYSEHELSAYATAFNRFWLTTLILGLWQGLQVVRRRFKASTPEKSDPHSDHNHLVTMAALSEADLHPATVACTHACETLHFHEEESIPAATQQSQDSPCHPYWVAVQLTCVGLFLAADLILWAWSLTRTSIANATLLANLTPLFTCLGGWLFWKKQFDQKFLMGLAIALAGTLLIGLHDLHAGGKLAGDLAALLAALAFGVYLLILEHLQTHLSPLMIILGSSAIAAVATWPIVWYTGAPWFPVSWQGWLSILSLALICQVLGQGLLVYSLNQLSSEFVAIFLLLDPIVAAIGGWILFSETLSPSAWAAFAIVLVGIYLASASESAKQEPASVGI